MSPRTPLTYALLCALSGLTAASCGDGAASPNPEAEPQIALPLEVYPNQTFIMDGSGSTIFEGTIRGYVFTPGDDTPALISRDARLAYAYDALGTFTAQLRLLDSAGVTQSTITVVPCDTPALACAPNRPCPPGYTCQGDVCEDQELTCDAHTECPTGLSCVQGLCQRAEACVDPPPAPPAPPTPPTPPDGQACATHLDCSDVAFCVEGQCRTARCEADCEAQITASYLLDQIAATGLALNHNALEDDPDARFYVLDDSGSLWAYSFDQLDAAVLTSDPNTPPAFQGVLLLRRPMTSPFFEERLRPQWLGLDFVNGEDMAMPESAFLISTGHDSGPIEVLGRPLTEQSQPIALSSEVQYKSDFDCYEELGSSDQPILVNSFGTDFIGYNVLDHTLAVSTRSLQPDRRIGRYEPLPGAMVCGVARDSEMAYLLENRVAESGFLSAARLVAIPLSGGAPRFFDVPVGAACALERGLRDGQLYYASWTTSETSWIIEHQLP